jgi:hypothetical protein
MFAILATSALAVVSLSGCSAVGSLTDLVEGKSDVFSLGIGDCFNDEDVEAISSVKVLDCTTPHDNEIFSEFLLADDFFGSGSYNEEEVFSDADEKCLSSFEAFVGASYAETTLNFSYLYPTAESWSQNDRLVQCIAYWDEGQISEPLKGKGIDYVLE